MWIILAVLLAIGWLVGFTVMKVTSVALHLLLLFAVVSVVSHFVSRRTKST